jgi:hypothetical protein
MKYKAMCDGTLYEGATGDDATRHVPRGRKRVAARKAIIGLAFLATYVLLSPRFSYVQILRDGWLEKGWLGRYVSKVNRRNMVHKVMIGCLRCNSLALWSVSSTMQFGV